MVGRWLHFLLKWFFDGETHSLIFWGPGVDDLKLQNLQSEDPWISAQCVSIFPWWIPMGRVRYSYLYMNGWFLWDQLVGRYTIHGWDGYWMFLFCPGDFANTLHILAKGLERPYHRLLSVQKPAILEIFVLLRSYDQRKVLSFIICLYIEATRQPIKAPQNHLTQKQWLLGDCQHSQGQGGGHCWQE